MRSIIYNYRIEIINIENDIENNITANPEKTNADNIRKIKISGSISKEITRKGTKQITSST